jgi:hypothetical protein
VSARGRLIWPFVARIGRIDPGSIAAVDGFDDAFRETRQLEDGTQTGRDARVDMESVDLSCQVEDRAWEALRMSRAGGASNTEITLVFHFEEIERLGFLDPVSGMSTIPRVGDKLLSIHRGIDKELVQSSPVELFCVEAQPRSYGLRGGKRNLLVCLFRERAVSSERV